jgi:diguanylate cyclase (GGDEF)-like protein/PAS domain S-box-containing protein
VVSVHERSQASVARFFCGQQADDEIRACDTTATGEVDLQKSLRLYQTMFERGALGQVIVHLPSFRIGVVNAAFCAMTGFRAEEWIGASLSRLFPAGQNPIAEITARLAVGTTNGYTAERRIQCRDSTVLPVLSTVAVVRDDDGIPTHLLAMIQDLSRQRGSERRQRRDNALIEAATASLPVSFSTFDRDLYLTFVARGRERAGTRSDEQLGRPITEISRDRVAIQALRDALTGEETTSRTVLDGETYLALNAPMRDDEGEIIGVMSVQSNVTVEVAAAADRHRAAEIRLFAAQHDALTGLFGRSGLVEYLNTLALADQSAGALLLIDLDDFNLINDSLGHTIGDAVLLEVASRLFDAFSGLVIARYGGDEFAVVVPDAVDRPGAEEAVRRVCAALDADADVFGHAIRVRASLGVAVQATPGSATLIRNADSALAHAKQAGVGQYRLYDAAMRREVRDRISIEDGLRAALDCSRLQLAYQPIVNLGDRATIGAEALLRWTDHERGPIPPSEFIPVAEQSGLIVPIGEWVMNTACEKMQSIQSTRGLYVAVNVSARQLVEGRFAEWVEAVLARTGLPPHALTVEVTESALMEDVDVVLVGRAFDRLRKQGVRVAIDDFGTGYSSLARLQHLPVDIIKLDRAFVIDVDASVAGRAMAAAILHVSTAIGAGMIAEGVETELEASTLLDLGYTAAQGYLFAKPMPIGALDARLDAEIARRSAAAESTG